MAGAWPPAHSKFLVVDGKTAVANHTPEVLRFYTTDGQTNAFSLYHTMACLESDEAILGAIGAANESIDLSEDLGAIADFKQEFEHQWERGVPAEKQMLVNE